MKRVILFVGLLSLVSAMAMGAVDLRFSDWHMTEDVWMQSLVEAIAIFEARYPDINVTLEPVSYGDKETKYSVETEAGAAPDVYHLHGYSLNAFIEKGYLLDITDEVMANAEDILDSRFPATLDLCQKDGRYYAIPGDFMSMVLYYNKNLFQEAGLDPNKPPATWEEFLDYAKKLTRVRANGDETWGFGTHGALGPGFELRFSPVLFSFGAEYLTPDMKHSALNTPEALAAIEFFVELSTVHKVIPPGVTTQGPQDIRTLLANERVAMILGSGWTPPIVNGINPDLDAFNVLEAAPVPVKAGVDTPYTTTAWISAWMVSSTTKHPEEAWTLLNFITSKAIEEKWFREDRVLSSREDVSNEYNDILNDKFAAVIGAELAHAKFVPQLPEWPEIINAVNIAVQEALAGDKTPANALADAHNYIEGILGN